jgi:hypothetical protein
MSYLKNCIMLFVRIPFRSLYVLDLEILVAIISHPGDQSSEVGKHHSLA